MFSVINIISVTQCDDLNRTSIAWDFSHNCLVSWAECLFGADSIKADSFFAVKFFSRFSEVLDLAVYNDVHLKQKTI